jgi:uncharacterized membrane protein YkvA (DUF1232 family)
MTQNNSDKASNILQEIWQNGQLALRLFTDGRVPLMLKVLVPAAALAYIVMPIDLLPDFIPVLGQLDEVAIILLLMRLFVSMSPQEVVAEHRQHMAGTAEGAAAGAAPHGQRAGAAPKNNRDDVIDADFRVVSDA